MKLPNVLSGVLFITLMIVGVVVTTFLLTPCVLLLPVTLKRYGPIFNMIMMMWHNVLQNNPNVHFMFLFSYT